MNKEIKKSKFEGMERVRESLRSMEIEMRVRVARLRDEKRDEQRASDLEYFADWINGEFEKQYHLVSTGTKTGADLFAWIEQQLAETHAATVERVLQVCNADRGNNTWGALLKAIRALSPDPHWLERVELKARLDEHKWIHQAERKYNAFKNCEEDGRIIDYRRTLEGRAIDLDRQLAEVRKERK